MKLLILFSVLLALSYADHYKVEVHDDLPSPRIGPKGEVIAEKIRALRDELKKKYNGIIENEKISLNLEEQNIKADITATGEIKELLNFEVIVKQKLIPPYPATYTYELEWNNIDIDISAYDLTGYVHMIQVYGKGTLKLNIKKLIVKGQFQAILNLNRAPSIQLSSLSTDIAVEGFNFKITGWLNDEIRSQILSVVITNNFPKIMTEYKAQIDQMVGDTLFNLVKDIKIPLS